LKPASGSTSGKLSPSGGGAGKTQVSKPVVTSGTKPTMAAKPIVKK